VVRTHGGHYYVQTAGQVLDCSLRGRAKKERMHRDLVVIGDRVRWSALEADVGIIEEVLPRKSLLARTPPPPRPRKVNGRYVKQHLEQQVIIANLDQVLLVFALYSPTINPLMLDRYLVACEATRLPAVIVANKVDLLEEDDEHDELALYRQIGYAVYYTSTVTGQGIDELRALVRGRLSVLTGPSGVGKSSLLNALWPALERKVGEVSESRDRGKHTTVVSQLLQPEPGTFVADTPGMRQFRFWDIDPEQLDAFFPEMRPYIGQCRFSPCTHIHEPGCAIVAAVEREKISVLRYESYCRMFEQGF
jgi:ribosome biogenesis GTPase / thiamine phosphate phosphatase